MKVKPLKTMVLLQKVSKPREEIVGGIIVSGEDESQPIEATVMSIGDEVMELSVSDTVLVSREDGMGGFPVKFNDTEYIMIDELDVLALVDTI